MTNQQLNAQQVDENYVQQSTNQQLNAQQVDEKLEHEFYKWFYEHVHDPLNSISNQFLKDLSKRPLRSYTSYSGYVVNGFKFRSISHNSYSATVNSGVCIKGTNYSSDESDFYGQLVEVVRLEYPGLPIKRVVLFRCNWFDPTPNTGTKVDCRYKLVEVNNKKSFSKYEPFVLAVQAAQVHYSSFPSLKRDKIDWWAVFKAKSRPALELPEKDNPGTYISRDKPFQQNEMENPLINVDIDDAPQALINIDVDEVELDSESGDESDDESELHSEDDNDLSMTDEENEVDFDNDSE